MAIHKYSRQREAIKEFLLTRQDHPTADTVYTCLREDFPNISLGTVYRNLALLTEMGEITRISTGIGPERYDAVVTSHQHFICTRCQRVFDIESGKIDKIMDNVMDTASEDCPGKIESYSANFYGICADCL